MSHYTEGVLQAYLDQEVPAESRAAVDAHVAGCAACAARLHELRELAQSFSSALGLTDLQPIPAAALAELRLHARKQPWARFQGTAALLRAATIVLSISAVAAATVPGSPLNGWLRQVWREVTVKPEPAPVTAPIEAVAPTPDSPGAIYLAPADGRVRVALQSMANGTTVEVRLVDSDRAMVHATNHSSFRTSAGRVEIVGGSGNVRILIPRSASDATIEVDGVVYVSRSGDELKLVSSKAEKLPGRELTFRPGND